MWLTHNANRPLALFNPAKSHPEVVVQSISARDRKKAEEYAKSHGIPEVRDTYQGKTTASLSSTKTAPLRLFLMRQPFLPKVY
jgi:hypothetical protein